MVKTCTFCDKSLFGRGLCAMHYARAQKNGTLHTFKTNSDRLHEMTMAERLKSKIKITENGCWEWIGAFKHGPFKYGLIVIDDKNMRAHRVSYETFKHPILPTDNVLHICDNPPCINPDHLFIGTRDDNNKDMARKGRAPINENRKNCKLTAKQVLEIRARTDVSGSEFARRLNVSNSLISFIRTGKRRLKAHI